MQRRSFLKFIASAVVAKSLLDNVAVKAIESVRKVSGATLGVAASAGFNVGDRLTISGVSRIFTVTQVNSDTEITVYPALA